MLHRNNLAAQRIKGHTRVATILNGGIFGGILVAVVCHWLKGFGLRSASFETSARGRCGDPFGKLRFAIALLPLRHLRIMKDYQSSEMGRFLIHFTTLVPFNSTGSSSILGSNAWKPTGFERIGGWTRVRRTTATISENFLQCNFCRFVHILHCTCVTYISLTYTYVTEMGQAVLRP